MNETATSPGKVTEEKPLLLPKDDPSLVDKVAELWEDSWKAKSMRNALEARCVAFYDGLQWLRWSTEQAKYIPNIMFPRHIRPITENEVGHTVDDAVAILSASQPSFYCPPASTDEADRNRADVATSVAEHLQETLNTPEFDEDLKLWKSITGMACLESEYNEKAGPWDPVMGVNPATGQPEPMVMGEDGPVLKSAFPTGKPVRRPRGAIERNLYTSLETFPDPASSGYHDAAWVAFATTVSPKDAERRFGLTASEVENLKGQGRWAKFVALARRVFSNFTISPSGTARTGGDIVLVKLHQAPCAEAPSGRCIMVLGGKVIYDEPSQTEGQVRFPFSVFTHGRNRKRWFPAGIVERLLEVQEELNRVLTRYGNTVRLMGNPKILLPGDSGVNQKAWTDKEGEIVRYNPGANGEKPEYMQGVTMPPAVMQYIQHLLATFQRLAGINESTMGILPSSDTSGKAIQALQGRDTMRLSKVSRRDARTWAKVMSYELFLAARYWPEDYKISVVGRDLKPFLLTFDGSQFLDPVDIRVVTGEGMPDDPQAAQQAINQMFAPGGPMVTLPPSMRRHFLSLSKNPSLRFLLMDENPYELNVRRQIADCKAGQKPIVIYNDDHATARRILSSYMVSEEFRELEDAQKQLVAALDTEHAQYEQMPKDGQGITMPPMAVMPAAPVPAVPGGPGPTAPPPDLQRQHDAAGIPPQVQPHGSPPAARAA